MTISGIKCFAIGQLMGQKEKPTKRQTFIQSPLSYRNRDKETHKQKDKGTKRQRARKQGQEMCKKKFLSYSERRKVNQDCNTNIVCDSWFTATFSKYKPEYVEICQINL